MSNDSLAQGGQTIRPLDGLYKVMRAALIMYILVEIILLVQIAVALNFFGKLQSGAYDMDAEMIATANLIDASGTIVGIAYTLIFIFSVVMVSRFTFRALKNLHTAGASGVKMTPGWAVGWYFIPIANLWKPLEGMYQIWRGSLDPQSASAPISPTIGWWWACWLLTNMFANVSFHMSGGLGEASSLEILQLSLWLDVIGGGLGIAAAFLLIKFTRRISDAQSTLMHGGIAETFS